MKTTIVTGMALLALTGTAHVGEVRAQNYPARLSGANS